MDVWWRPGRASSRTDRPLAWDVLPVVVAVAMVIVIAAQWNEPGTAVDLALLGVAAAVLVAAVSWPRVRPDAATLVVLAAAGTAVGHHGHLELGLFLVVLMTLHTAWHVGSTARAVAVAVVCAAVLAAISITRTDSFSWPPWAAAELFTLVLGRTLGNQRMLIDQLEAARRTLAEQAVAEERRRMARELHDLAGHTLAAMLLHVTGARHVLRRDLDDAERALLDAEAVGRQSMEQIRQAVAALRTAETGLDAPLAGGAELAALVEEYRRAGLVIDADIDAGLAQLSGPVGTALHRIGREALANTARHAPNQRVAVRAELDHVAHRVRLVVQDHGQGGSSVAPGTATAPGFGVVGMRERATALGGTLHAAATADGWRVEAALPLPPGVPGVASGNEASA